MMLLKLQPNMHQRQLQLSAVGMENGFRWHRGRSKTLTVFGSHASF